MHGDCMLKLLTAGLLALSPAAPAEPTGFSPQGVYLFHTDAQIEEQPVCSELWDFVSNDVLLIKSGAERVRKSYRVKRDSDGVWIVSRTLETNGAPDCMGERNPDPSPDERRTYVIPMNDGRTRVCPAPATTESGAPFISNCFGWLVPADQAG